MSLNNSHPQLLNFPKNFLWGAATAGHQVEGNNVHSDWWDWEQSRDQIFQSGQACDSYNLYEKDFDWAKSLNQNAHRLSIEWARIEPEEGKFEAQEIKHYRNVLKALKKRQMKVMLTLWHFTLPKWLAEAGGWENPKAVDYFARFIEKVALELKAEVDFWVTLNEPGIYLYCMYIDPKWPNARKSLVGQTKSFFNLVAAHKKAYQVLHQIDPQKPVGIADNYQSFTPFSSGNLLDKLAAKIQQFQNNKPFYLLTKNYHDFIGINYYFHHLVKVDLPKIQDIDLTNQEENLQRKLFHDSGLVLVINDAPKHLPVYITECGTHIQDEEVRVQFLINRLTQVKKAIDQGRDVKGFFYWSLLDNFEWENGYNMKFGLLKVDFKTQKRSPRKAARVYAEIIKQQGLSSL